MQMERDFIRGDGQMMQCEDNVLSSCTLVWFCNQCHPKKQ